MSLLNRGAHTHFGQQERKQEEPVNKYAELAAYIKERTETAVAQIEAMKGNITESVTRAVRLALNSIDIKLGKIDENVDNVLSTLETNKDSIVESAISEVQNGLDSVVDLLEKQAKEDIAQEFESIREEYITSVKEEVVELATAELDSAIVNGISSIETRCEAAVQDANTEITATKDSAKNDILTAQQTATESVNTAKSAAEATINSLRQNVEEVIEQATASAEEALEARADELIENAGLARGFEYTESGWDTGNTYNGSKVYGCLISGFFLVNDSTTLSNFMPSGAVILDYNFLGYNGASKTHEFDTNSGVVTRASGATSAFYLEILYFTP